MPTISYSIGGEKHDISGKSGEEVVKMVKAEYTKQKNIIKKQAEKPKCNYCDSVSVIEWKEWGVWLCIRCAIHNNKQLKKLIDSCN